MNPLILLFLLGLITYFIVQRVASVTRSPVWLLWLVAMAPAIVSSGWVLAKGKPMPSQTILILSGVCLLVYWFLIQRNRIVPPPVNSAAAEGQEQPPAMTKEAVTIPSSPRPIDKAEETSLQNCFPWSIYYLQNVEYRPQAVICRGQLRSKPEVAYQTIQENVAEVFGDRFYLVFQEGANQKPFFVLVPNPRAQEGTADASVPAEKRRREIITRPFLAIGLFIATFFTTTLAWLDLGKKAVQLSSATLVTGLPYALTLMTILGIHELGHYLTARRYKIKATLPYFIPVIPIPLFPFGTFGAFIQIRSPIPHRRALFDVGIAGPIAGFAVALPLLLWGLAHSEVVRLPEKLEAFNFQALNPNFSLLLALLSKLTLGNALTTGYGLNLHPVAVASCLGIVVTAFNLMPVGQLDGGHIVHAMFGQRAGTAIGQIARLLLLALSFVQSHLLVWAILLFLMPATDEPALNDVTELDNRRDLWGILALGLLLIIILPMPSALGKLLNL
ncbi:site-2 protease family protein [Stenomitos frigidus]|uniref:Site-2 protease family protein n=1 Tax=Stenomitos frigidus ULC18 TaxID=2107698 RepID=A0A2T1E8A2_9CYAN|nr:site-2 protease family protein [Stenomitos frigidus]PSB28960.1 site-2 protease family protein [Stenomitos frigidus ULC18]